MSGEVEKIDMTRRLEMLRDVREYDERLAAIQARVRSSLNDPRPDLNEDVVERHFANLHAETAKIHRGVKV